MDKNPTLIAVGVGGALIGSRLDKVVYDDLSDDENQRTELQRQNLWRFLAETGKTRMNPTRGRQIMIGTRWHESDAIGYAIDRGWHILPRRRRFLFVFFQGLRWRCRRIKCLNIECNERQFEVLCLGRIDPGATGISDPTYSSPAVCDSLTSAGALSASTRTSAISLSSRAA